VKSVAHPEKRPFRQEVAAEYRAALEQFLSGAGEAALQQAYELGRRAVAEGFGVLEMVLLHCTVVDDVPQPSLTSEEEKRRQKAATEFLLEALAPHEMAYRGARDAILSLRQLNRLLEEQGRKIAHAIHDEAGQLMIAVHLALTELVKEVPSELHARFGEVTALMGQIEDDLRGFSHELRPTILDDLGLEPALEFLADRVSKRTRLAVRVESSLKERLPSCVEVVMYRVVQEALANAARHGRAQGVRILLEKNDCTFRCSIHDDGIGFDVTEVLGRKDRPGLGLIGMGERLHSVGGTLQIKSVPGDGTKLLISIPVEESNASSSVSRR
jgi:signal transduction histidine kinase